MHRHQYGEWKNFYDTKRDKQGKIIWQSGHVSVQERTCQVKTCGKVKKRYP